MCRDREQETIVNDSAKPLAQMKKAGKLVRLNFRKNGPKSYKRGQGALLGALLKSDGATQRELVNTLGVSRSVLKDVVRKAQRNGYVEIVDGNEKKTYSVKLTDEGRKLAEKHEAANDKTADAILDVLSKEERAQLDAITEKLILACKDAGIDGHGKGRKTHRRRKGHRHH